MGAAPASLRSHRGRGGATAERPMKIRRLHDWDLTPPQAVALQRRLAGEVDTTTPLAHWNLIAGADVSYNLYSPVLYAGVVVLRADDLSVVERRGMVAEATFPYVPG